MLIKNVFLENAKEAVDVRVKDGKFETIAKNITKKAGENVLDLGGKLMLPPFIDSHMHLDSVLTAGEPVWNLSGTLFEGIEIWSKRKQTLTADDVKSRVNRAVRMQAAHGIQHIRTHVDVTDEKLTALKAIVELREELKNFVNIQIVAFPQEGIMSYKNGRALMERAIAEGADVVGAIPHFEYTREYGVESVNFAIELALKHNKLVDIHCDEIDDDASRFLETVATRAYESGLKSKVTASHTTAMGSYNNAYAYKLFRILGKSDINFVSNPHINTHIQGRTDTYPKRRGLTRVKELLANGNNVSFGYDCIQDPWYPLGTGNMLDPVHMGLHVCQMMGYEEILNSYKLVTTNAAKTLSLKNYGIKKGNPASFIILDATNFHEALSTRAPVLYSYKNGNLLASTQPAKTQITF
ncbi:MAG: cytosine deaminase [Firmicutes bacterium]|nr:cytosine deaminase [Bacillota bacterium]